MTITVEGKVADIPAHLMEGMREAAMDAFRRAEPVGDEIAGLLFGARSVEGWTVTAWRPIPREDGSKPAVPLTESEEEAAGEILWEYKTDKRLRGAEPVGWVRSRTRGMAALSPEDADVCRHLFGDEGSLAVILRPSTQRPMTAAFFYVAPETPVSEFSRRGVMMSVLPIEDAHEETVDVPQSVETGLTTESPVFGSVPLAREIENEPPARHRRWVLPLLGALVGALTAAAGCFLFLDRPLHLDGEIRRSPGDLNLESGSGLYERRHGRGTRRWRQCNRVDGGRITVGNRLCSGADLEISRSAWRLRGPYADKQRSVLTSSGRPVTERSNNGMTELILALKFLTGCWSLESKGALVDEAWSRPAGGVMAGYSRTVRGDRLVTLEYLRIEPRMECWSTYRPYEVKKRSSRR
jgi:hypothetical protein